MGGMARRVVLPHGTFFFAPPPLPHPPRRDDEDGHDSDVASSYSDHSEPNAVRGGGSPDDDDRVVLDVENERERCARYGYDLSLSSPGRVRRRRRLFAGSLLADDPVEVLRAVGAEVHDVFHTVSYVESNATQTLEPRDWKYADENDASKLEELRGLFGPRTRVSVDRYVHALHENTMVRDDEVIWLDGMDREYFQREGSLHRWKMNGMRVDDVGVILDADETMSRDFLRAMQVCDVPEFRPGQDCRRPKVIVLTMTYESSPDCAKGADDTWFHPDAMLGECVDGIGSASDHPPTRRDYFGGKHGQRMEGYGHDGDYSRYHAEEGSGGREGGAYYPLWQPVDFRTEEGGRMVEMVGGSPTGYHFHNFFDSTGQIKFKYRTYGHPHKNAMDVPIWKLSEELKFAVECARGTNEDALDFHGTGSGVLPVYYLNDDARIARHRLWQDIVREEEEYWNRTTRAAEAEEEEEEEEEDEEEDTKNKRKRKRIKNFQEKWRAKKALELRREERELRRARKRSKHEHALLERNSLG